MATIEQVKPRYPRGPRLKVKITAELIELAKVRDSSHCMIAEAVRDVFPPAAHISVDIQTIRFSIPDRGIRCTYLTPRIAQVGIVDFDQGETPKPFSFQLIGAQVTRMLRRAKSQVAPRPRSEAQKAAVAKATAVLRPDPGNRVVPDKIGGRTPPLSRYAHRREFGLRALRR